MDVESHTILIVDDVKENQRIVTTILEDEGYITKVAADGLTALRLVKEFDFDLILLDIMMPIMDGIQTCRYLKVEPKSATIPVIFLTANTERELLIRAYNVGGSDYIRKPFFKEELLARVDTRIKLREYEKELEAKVEQRTQEMANTQVELLHTLGGIAEGHSVETYNHVKRVSLFTYKLAKLYGMDEEEAILLKNASSLHDIGKLGIIDNILHKKGVLTNSEYKVMKTHTNIGVDILEGSNLPVFKVAKIVAEQHHEKYDGTGYPGKLQAEDIHIYARIVAIADVFDALCFQRAYKKCWSLDEVLFYMKDTRGKHFDPQLIDIFFKNIDEFVKIHKFYTKDNTEETHMELGNKKGKIMEWLLKVF
jgi:putative two-component system response regulator